MSRGRHTWTACMAAMVLAGGCGDADPGTTIGELDPLPEPPAFAAVMSDYSSAAIGFLDAEGEVLAANWINSGTTEPGIVATLSGDVVLPTERAADGSFTLIDRLRTDVITRFEMPSGELIGQVRTHGEPMDTGFSSNPHDYLQVDESTAWVTRFGVQLDTSEPPQNQGNDLLRIDPGAMVRTDDRVDLSTFDTTGTVQTDGGPMEVDVYARPDRMVRLGDVMVVGLSRLSLDFSVSGPGLTAVVSTDGSSLSSVPHGDLRNCGMVAPVPGADDRAIVACVGFSQPFDDEAQTRATAGLALVEANGLEVGEVLRWQAADDADSAIAVQNVTSLGGTVAVAVDFGSHDPAVPDRLYRVDLATGEQTPIHESTEAFALGKPALDPATGLLLVPDAADGVHRFQVEEDRITEIDVVEVAPELGLPVRRVSRL
ncbi:MAG: hypothetical protein ACOCV4_03965 [Myxococcota bacterium]